MHNIIEQKIKQTHLHIRYTTALYSSNYYHKNHKSINRSAKLSNYAINNKREMITIKCLFERFRQSSHE
jgi:hypothetical protein